jgi:hypothetical protein
VVSGVTSYATAGPLAFYVSGEYQHAPGDARPIERPGGNIVADESHASVLAPPSPIREVNRLRLRDAYVALSYRGWQASFGQQSLWWGPGSSGPLMWSTNAEPALMLRVSRTTPITLPWVLSWLGPMRTEYVFGELAGHRFEQDVTGVTGTFARTLSRQPYINAQKVSFHPTPNLEFGISRSGMIGGPNFPVTAAAVGRSLTSPGTTGTGPRDAGDRRTGFDFSYRLPYLRKWLVLTNDSMAEDEISPIAYPRRSAMSPGLYMPQVPKLPKLELRVEAPYTDLPGLIDTGFFYWNVRYLDGFTNRGNVMGSWVGREGRGLSFKGRYWFSAQQTVDFAYRKQGVNPEFLQGGTLHDFSVRGAWQLGSGLTVEPSVQYEKWNFPLLAPGAKNNVAASVQLTWRPKLRVQRSVE